VWRVYRKLLDTSNFSMLSTKTPAKLQHRGKV
jgi:hypothetical protein